MRSTLEKQFKNGKINLIMALILTVVNMVMILTESNYSFPFSVFFPQFVVALLKYGMFGSTANIIATGVIAICLGAYFTLAMLAHKHYNFLVGALVLFSVDTVLLIFYMFATGEKMIVDVLFHLWVLAYLIIGVRAGVKLYKLPTEPAVAQSTNEITPLGGISTIAETPAEVLNTKPLRAASKKGRMIISTDYNGMKISINRSFALTELIVNGCVYGEQKGLVEMPYYFEVYVMNTKIGCQLTQNIGTMKMAILVDGKEIAFKNRII